jgi:glycine cleavage system H lipoate-binding protein
MPYQVLAPETEPCVWMCAGLISYRLCDRGFDCESCPLDAALRGHMEAATAGPAHLDRRVAEGFFPGDRLYSPGHLWVQALSHADARVWRVGLDAFATALIGCATGVRSTVRGETVHRGDRVCDVDLGFGTIGLASPVSGRFLRANPELVGHPHQVVTEPYAGGWILEIEGLDPGAILGLRSATVAFQQTVHDLRRFRRSLALRLLTASGGNGHSSADASESLRDLRQALCGAHYTELLGQFVH